MNVVNCEGIINWLGRLEGVSPPVEIRSERLLRFESVLRAAILLRKRECLLMTLHDIEGYSLDRLRMMTGLSRGTIKTRVVESRLRIGPLLKPSSPKRPPLALKGDQS